MIKTYSTVKEEVLRRWDLSAEAMQIPRGAYEMPIKIAHDETGKSNYTFGVIYSPYRKKRPSQSDLDECQMCRMANEAQIDKRKNLFPEKYFGDFVNTTKAYP